MEPTIITVIISVVALALGAIAGKFLFAKNTKKNIEDAKAEAQRIIADGQMQAETLKKEKNA